MNLDPLIFKKNPTHSLPILMDRYPIHLLVHLMDWMDLTYHIEIIFC